MSISIIKFADKLNMKLSNNRIGGGIYSALNDPYSGYYNFYNSFKKQISFVETSTETEIFIETMTNTLKLVMRYTLTVSGDVYSLTYKYCLLDSNGNIVNISGLNNPRTITMTKNPQHSYIPFSNCYQTLAKTTYQSNPPIIAGAQADGAVFPGNLFIQKPAIIGNEPVPLEGSVSFSDLFNDWEISEGGATFSNDTDYGNFKTAVINAGDGEDPFTTDEPTHDGPDPSTPGGGDRPSSEGGDAVDFPGLPTTNVINTGLISMYNPSGTNLHDLAGELWSNDFENTIKKILNDPFDGIIGLTLVPFSPHTSGNAPCKIGNYISQVNMPLVDQQYITLDCGSLKISESWHNALDYSPATNVDLYIPFVGFKPLKTEDVMNNTISLKYNVDLLSGSAVAFVKCGDKVMYTYPCKLTYDVPLTGSNRAALYTGMINVAMSAIRGAAMGGALGAVGGAATSAISTATSKQSEVDRSGAITSNTGDLGEFTPFVLLHRPIQSMPEGFKNVKGYQSNITEYLSAISGYTEVEYIHLTGIDGATDTELAEIETLLKRGVII